jgi:AraC family transcriptional regulator of adaptative response/methylated-DNA-[protein]-cysteine methyltransferase
MSTQPLAVLPSPVPPEQAGPLPYNARIAAAIAYIVDHYQEQPSLEIMAAASGLSPYHFQRVFKRWAGISPKRFLQYVTLDQAKRLLQGEASVLDAALDAGLSGPSRLHDLFVACDAMTPGEFKARRETLVIRWGLHETPLGRILLGVTARGVCWLAFVDDEADAIAAFEAEWQGATLIRDEDGARAQAERAFEIGHGGAEPLPLLLKGTNFQLKVWEALLRIPFGSLVSYQAIASAIGQPRAVRAVGAAIGRNNISWLIPCHRVILGTGIIHNYRWGVAHKRRLLAVEAALAGAKSA